ncbi:MAG: hypothetical protein CVU90_02545 [Firmicutes bacterium HGW-Firmicutes-15]|nr:MAG: hypothetical protein CVU90_02545 [Firmicutes bacterium HGW-Firmicutes-15]
MLLVFIMAIQIITLSGCWDYRDINSVALPQLGAYDIHEESRSGTSDLPQEEKLVDLTVVIPNLSEEVKAKFRIEKTPGLLIGNSRGQKPYSSPGDYSPAVASIIVFGEDEAATGLNKLNEALSRGAKNPHTVNYSVAEGRGENILRVPTDDYSTMGDYLRLLLRSSEKRGFIPSSTLHQFEVDQNPGKNPVMPLLIIKDEKVMVNGAAIFNKDKMIGKVGLKETQYLMMLRGIESNGNLPYILNKDGKIYDYGSLSITNNRKVTMERNGNEFTFNISIILEGGLNEHSSNVLFTQNKDLRKEIEDQVTSDITEGCNKFIKRMQEEYKVDCIDISKYALAKWRKELQPTIDQGFIENVAIKVDVKMKLKSIGELN